MLGYSNKTQHQMKRYKSRVKEDDMMAANDISTGWSHWLFTGATTVHALFLFLNRLYLLTKITSLLQLKCQSKFLLKRFFFIQTFPGRRTNHKKVLWVILCNGDRVHTTDLKKIPVSAEATNAFKTQLYHFFALWLTFRFLIFFFFTFRASTFYLTLIIQSLVMLVWRKGDLCGV